MTNWQKKLTNWFLFAIIYLSIQKFTRGLIMVDFGNRLEFLLKERRITRKELADKLQISPSKLQTI